MKARIIITPKKAVLDPQAEAIQRSLDQMGVEGVSGLTLGKYIEVEIAGDQGAAEAALRSACERFLANPVIEEYSLEVVEE